MKRKSGYYEKLGNLDYFNPYPLPPKDPSIEFNNEMIELYGNAMNQLGKLNEMVIPNLAQFIKSYIIKEAILSSEIEGINTTITEIFTQPIVGEKISKETRLIINYSNALEEALKMIQQDKMPISNRVILKAHEILMSCGEGAKSNPGQYRKQSVRVGNLVPPVATKIPQLMSELEHYINTNESLPPLIKAGLAHVHFETIHPFLDGNGRIGRMLIMLILINNGILYLPIIYPSYYFKKNQNEYYRKLDSVRIEGDFEGWLTFYLQSIYVSCVDAYSRSKDIEKINKKLTDLILQSDASSKTKEQAINVLFLLFEAPIISIQELSKRFNKSYNWASNMINFFINLEILKETEDKKRNRVFKFSQYLDLLDFEYK